MAVHLAAGLQQELESFYHPEEDEVYISLPDHESTRMEEEEEEEVYVCLPSGGSTEQEEEEDEELNELQQILREGSV